ncbi:aspartate/glutamate racemase family protein [Arthrobacter sp. I2-34]|uniref:Aspartate/glutamate racemase family protein n=1 Tax=Arthrobacter hankyongi TaxID=2904801 RepID=A0ABS9L7A7_9MICC|nr:aspartate/glutamate racemase family protein [Arthrobacter hankyongi]MCG2622549.1 aspartate/glutamate racemase family protein [Arthrobacter hankyongi]
MDAPGPSYRLGVLVPSSNSNAESMTAAMLADQPDVGVHYSRFRLPPSLDDAIDAEVLGEAPALLADAEVAAVAFHGTSGSWTGVAGDRALCAGLAAATGAPATTASLAVLAALQALSAARIAVVFPGPAGIARLIEEEYARHGIEVAGTFVPATVMSNPQIALLGRGDIESMMRPAFMGGADAVVCIGTNLRSGYLAAGFEAEYGLPVVDSATATLWHLLQLAGAARPIPGWGRLLAMS